MNGELELATHVLVVALLALQLISILTGRSYQRLMRLMEQDPTQRAAFYRKAMVGSWIMATFAVEIVLVSGDLSFADIGWTWPGGDGLDYLLAAYLLVMILVGGLQYRRAMRRGRAYPAREAVAPMIPQTPRERLLAVGVALTAGITEELVYRGLLIGVGTRVYHLPALVVVPASLVLFVAAHRYQGRRALPGITLVGVLFTALYLVSGSLLLPIVVHVVQDLVALLLVPARPGTPAPSAVPVQPTAPVQPTVPAQQPVPTGQMAVEVPQPVPAIDVTPQAVTVRAPFPG